MSDTTARILAAKDPVPWEIREDGSLLPLVGVGASQGAGSDSYPFTVVAVSKTGHTITLRRDRARVVSGSFMSCDAEVEYAADPAGHTIVATRRLNLRRCAYCSRTKRATAETCDSNIACREERERRGGPSWLPVYIQKGQKHSSVSIGFRCYYQDPHF